MVAREIKKCKGNFSARQCRSAARRRGGFLWLGIFDKVSSSAVVKILQPSLKMQLASITGNQAKAEELGRHLRVPVVHQKIEILEIQSLDLREVIAHKATTAYERVRRPVLVEDTSLTFRALGKLPGPLVKRRKIKRLRGRLPSENPRGTYDDVYKS